MTATPERIQELSGAVLRFLTAAIDATGDDPMITERRLGYPRELARQVEYYQRQPAVRADPAARAQIRDHAHTLADAVNFLTDQAERDRSKLTSRLAQDWYRQHFSRKQAAAAEPATPETPEPQEDATATHERTDP